jgi:apolipoprotein N-acyltransferase
LGYFGSTLYWIAESFECVGFGKYGYIAVFLLVIYLAIFPATACFLTKLLSTTKINFMMFFAAFWTLTEYIRGLLFTGFPWNLIGYVTTDIPYFSQVADIIGIYGMSFLIVVLIATLFTLRTTICGLFVICAAALYGFYKTDIYDGYITPQSQCLVRIVQPSISQQDKVNLKKFQKNLNKLVELSGLASNFYRGNMLVVWPEAAITVPLNINKKLLGNIGKIINSENMYLITGNDNIDKNRNIYNSALVIDSEGQIKKIYDKRHLLPFGEFVPQFLLEMGIKKLTPGLMNFSKGKRPRTVHLEDFEKFELLLCYEIAFPGEVVDDQWSPWLLNLTNDSWFKNSDGPVQHLRTARFRAIEEGRPIVRCANNGISCIIDCNGKIQKQLGTDKVGHIDVYMPQRWQQTIFSEFKNNTILVIIACVMTAALYTRRNRRLNILPRRRP